MNTKSCSEIQKHSDIKRKHLSHTSCRNLYIDVKHWSGNGIGFFFFFFYLTTNHCRKHQSKEKVLCNSWQHHQFEEHQHSHFSYQGYTLLRPSNWGIIILLKNGKYDGINSEYPAPQKVVWNNIPLQIPLGERWMTVV